MTSIIQHLSLVHVHQVKQNMFVQLRPNVMMHSHTYVCLGQAFACLQLSQQCHILLDERWYRFTPAMAQAVLWMCRQVLFGVELLAFTLQVRTCPAYQFWRPQNECKYHLQTNLG